MRGRATFTMVESRKTVAEASTVATSVHRCARVISMYVSAVVKDEALIDFAAAREEWETAFAQVPDAALEYLKPGDDYALGGLQVHVNWVLVHYRRVLDGLIDRGFTQLPPLDPPGVIPWRHGLCVGGNSVLVVPIDAASSGRFVLPRIAMPEDFARARLRLDAAEKLLAAVALYWWRGWL